MDVFDPLVYFDGDNTDVENVGDNILVTLNNENEKENNMIYNI